MEFVLRVMPLTRLAVDALGVVTISLVVLLALIGLFCIIYTLYFCYRIQRSGFIRLGYFNGPWIVRICFILFAIWWGVSEIVRLGFLRQKGGVFNSLDKEWQEDMCKYYILANLGIAEPCLFITMSLLLRASLKWRGSGILSPRWNFRTAGYVLLCCLPIFVLDLIFVLFGPGKSKLLKLPPSFTRTTRILHTDEQHVISVCCFPLLCTIVHGLFTFILITYLLFLGRRMVSSVINKSLQRRVYILIFLVSCFLPSRVILLGFSVLARTRFLLLEALAFAGFLALLSCVIVAIFMLVYLPVSDSLALRSSLMDPEAGARHPYATATASSSAVENYRYDPIPLIATPASQSLEMSTGTSLGRNSDASTKPGSISFRTMIKDDSSTTGAFEEEIRVFSPQA